MYNNASNHIFLNMSKRKTDESIQTFPSHIHYHTCIHTNAHPLTSQPPPHPHPIHPAKEKKSVYLPTTNSTSPPPPARLFLPTTRPQQPHMCLYPASPPFGYEIRLR